MKKPIINYVWMQFEKGRIQPLPSHLFYNVQQNAKRYPARKFIVWVQDSAAIGPYHIPENVEIRTLDSIRGFSDMPVMKLNGEEYGWAKVDTARLLVIRHILENENCAAIYSDMDVPDVRVDASPLHLRLRKYGIAIGASFKGASFKGAKPSRKNIGKSSENGYIAFTNGTKDLLDLTIDACGQISDYGARLAVCDKQFEVISMWADAKGIANWQKCIASFPVLPPGGYINTKPKAQLRLAA